MPGRSGIPVVITYGMSETCGGCVYDGRPLDGVEVVVADDGQILIGGPVLFSGYRLRPELTRASLVDGRLAPPTGAGGTTGGSRCSGRRDDVVITGGLNVDLAAGRGPGRAVGRTRAAAEAWSWGYRTPSGAPRIVAVHRRLRSI